MFDPSSIWNIGYRLNAFASIDNEAGRFYYFAIYVYEAGLFAIFCL